MVRFPCTNDGSVPIPEVSIHSVPLVCLPPSAVSRFSAMQFFESLGYSLISIRNMVAGRLLSAYDAAMDMFLRWSNREKA